jgi:signal peptidase I
LTGRIAVRALAIVGAAALSAAIAAYFLNPFKTASTDPRLRVVGYAPFRIPSTSMEPTLRRNELFVVSARAYWHSGPQIGEVIVFQYPLDRSVVYVKRVIASGGSTVEIVDGVTAVDGKPLRELYVDPHNNVTGYARTMRLVRVPADALFVMGDNRDNSNDSRTWGFVPRSNVVGRVDSVSAPNNRWRGP